MTVIPLAALKKADVIHELEGMQVPGWDYTDTVVELKAILKVYRELQQPRKPSILKGLNGKKLVELQQLHRETGLGEPMALTRGLLINAIKHQVLGMQCSTERPESTPFQNPFSPRARSVPTTGIPRTSRFTGGTAPPPPDAKTVGPNPQFGNAELLKIRFGKHAGKTYQQALSEYPSYCEWVILTADIEDEASPELQHFAQWLVKKGCNGRMPAQEERDSPVLKGKNPTTHRMDMDDDAQAGGWEVPGEEPSNASASSDAGINMQGANVASA